MTRDEEIDYAKSKGIPVSAAAKKYSIDASVWGRAIECGFLEDASEEPPEDAYEWTVSPEKAPDKPEYVTISFEAGVPVAVNGKKMTHSNSLRSEQDCREKRRRTNRPHRRPPRRL